MSSRRAIKAEPTSNGYAPGSNNGRAFSMDAQVFVEIEYSQKFSVPPPDVVIDTVCITPVLSLACTSRSEIIKSSPPSCEIVIITEVGLVFAAVTVSLADGGSSSSTQSTDEHRYNRCQRNCYGNQQNRAHYGRYSLLFYFSTFD